MSQESSRSPSSGATLDDEPDADALRLAVAVGDPMPSIGLRASDGYLLNLRSYVGKAPVAFLLFAAPTAQGAQARRGTRIAEALAAGARRLAAADVAVVGVTCDNERQQANWIGEHRWPYLLFSDERRSAVDRLGIPLTNVGGNFNVARPVILVVGRDGIVDAIISDPEPDYVVDIVLSAVRRAQGGEAEPTQGREAEPTQGREAEPTQGGEAEPTEDSERTSARRA